MTARRSFTDRLALARRLVARGALGLPGHVADQLEAANAETRTLHDQLGVVLPALEPARRWRHRPDADLSGEVRAYLIAAVMGCLGDVCCHLRKGDPQPAFALLPLHRVACMRCTGIIRRPVTASDECDVCGAREVITFHPFAVRLGPVLVTGDACAHCAGVLGIRQEASA
jgi:hypothetical protein